MKLAPPDTPRGGGTVLVVLVAASLLLTTVYFREGGAGPLHSARRGVLAVSAPVARAGDWVTGPFRALGRRVSDFTTSRGDLQDLRLQNAELRARVAALEEARLENERLRALVDFAEANRLDALGARIIGRPTVSWESAITIDRGSVDGVRIGMPVLAQQGLLGQVVEVTRHSASVRLITDQRSGVAAMIQRTRAAGVVKGSVERRLTMDYVGRAAAPRRGDVVLTSGLGGVYPKGLLVGEVVAVDVRPSDLYPRVVVSSAVPFDQLEEVLVLKAPMPAIEMGSGE